MIAEACPRDPDAPDDYDPGPFVCPGCYAVGEEPCAPGCIDAEIAARQDDDRERGDDQDAGDDLA